MAAFPISVQLYSLREQAKEDFVGVLKKVADMGYVGVEFAGLHGMSPAEVRKVIDDLGLVASSTHGAFPNEENIQELIDTAKTLGYTRHIAGFGPPEFETKEKTLESAAKIQKAAELFKGSGITFGIHNHWWEFDKLFDGKTPHQVAMDAAPDAFAQVDTYWVAVGGQKKPEEVVKELGARAPLLHIKDGPLDREQAMTAVGSGKMDWKAIIGAAADTTEYVIVELDRCDTDMVEAVAQSYTYLVGEGLAKGRK